MAFAGNVGGDFHAIGQADASDFADSRVWLSWGFGRDFRAHAALKRRWKVNRAIFERIKRALKSNSFRLSEGLFSFSSDQLICRRHMEQKCTIYSAGMQVFGLFRAKITQELRQYGEIATKRRQRKA